MNLRFPLTLCSVAIASAVVFCAPSRASAQTAADIAADATKLCAVMSGQQKADGQALQLIQIMDDDLSDANPISLMLYRSVIARCPKSYLAFHQRMRASNPFPNLLGPSQSLLGTPAPAAAATPHDSPLRCRGGSGLATASGRTLTLNFTRSSGSASRGLAAGQCAWDGRAVSASEPTRITALLDTPARAADGAKVTNQGGTWTFWVYAQNGVLKTTAIAKGFPASKP